MAAPVWRADVAEAEVVVIAVLHKRETSVFYREDSA